MHRDIRKKLAKNLSEKLEFAKGVVSQPKTVGAIAPTSERMARKMASAIDLNSGLPVVEFGPGTGVITKAILDAGLPADKLFSIEFSAEFLPGLRRKYPGVNFIHGDAFDIAAIAIKSEIEQVDCIISALPLLNFPTTQRIRLVNAALDLLKPGRPMVQFSYSPRPPIPSRERQFTVKHHGTVIRNIPPARIWKYQRVVD